MRKVYKIKFEFEHSNNKIKKRNNSIQAILSELQDIESDTPIPYPDNGSTFTIGSTEYKALSHKFKIDIESDILYYQVTVMIKSCDEIKEEEALAEEIKRDTASLLSPKVNKNGGSDDWFISNL